jgi:hypothetical protein
MIGLLWRPPLKNRGAAGEHRGWKSAGRKSPHALLQTQIQKGEVGSSCFLVGGRKRPSGETEGRRK